VIIIIILKPDSRVNLGQDSGHNSSWLLTYVNVRIKMVIIIVLKPNLRIDLGLDLGCRSRGSTRVYPSQCIYKSSYYHNLKT
jgi:hypothetical protein